MALKVIIDIIFINLLCYHFTQSSILVFHGDKRVFTEVNFKKYSIKFRIFEIVVLTLKTILKGLNSYIFIFYILLTEDNCGVTFYN